MKPLIFKGDSLKQLCKFPRDVRKNAGFKLKDVQNGLEPSDCKVLIGLPPGIAELRLWGEAGTYRVVYVARFADAVYVLHAFQKKTAATTKRDLDLVRKRYEEVWQGLQRG